MKLAARGNTTKKVFYPEDEYLNLKFHLLLISLKSISHWENAERLLSKDTAFKNTYSIQRKVAEVMDLPLIFRP